MRHRHIITSILWALVAMTLGACSSKKALTPLEEGVARFDAKDYAAARAQFEAVAATQPDAPEVPYYLGRIALEEDKYDKALTHFATAVERAPANSEYHLWYGRATIEKLQNTKDFMQMGELASDALARLEKAVEVDPANTDARQWLAGFYMNAPPMAGGSLEKAKAQAEELIELDPEIGYSLVARIHLKNNNYDGAEAAYNDLIARDPKQPAGHYGLGMLYQQKKDYEAAFASLERALELDKNYTLALYQIGRTAVFSGTHVNRGIDCLIKYLEKEPGEDEPTWANARWRLGLLYEKQGKPDLARAQYEAALALDPDSEEAKKALEALGEQ